jgi:FAD:protein FMN transferase
MDLSQWFQKLAQDLFVEQAEGTSEAKNDAAPRHSIAERDSMLLSFAKPQMACEFEVLVNQNQYPTAAELAVKSLESVERLEQLFSVYKARSELSTLNRFGSQRPVAASEDTLTLLRLAQDLYCITNGAFDITAGSLSEVWGFSRREGAMPTKSQIDAALECVGTQYLNVDTPNRTAGFSREGVKVNPGGIGKGFALDRAASQLTTAGISDFMMHGGLSSVVARGNRQHSQTGGGWLVALKHPWRLEETLGTIRLRNQALGTSGSGKQFFHFGGKRYSHIIDPRTGQPAQGMMSATVICPSGAIADALATSLFVLGPEEAREFCDQHPHISAILVYLDSKSGRQRIETCNVDEDMWQPLRGDSVPVDTKLAT